jgi:hypothetical protein
MRKVLRIMFRPVVALAALSAIALSGSGCAASSLPTRGSPPGIGTRPALECAAPCPWRVVTLPRLGVTSQITGMVATHRGDVWVAAQTGRGWSDPQAGPDTSWTQPREHDVMLHLRAGRWARVPIPVTTGPITELTADRPDDIWAIANQRQLVRWNGRGWRVVATPNLPDATLIALCVVSRTDAWAVGSAFQPDGSSALIERWNGRTWHRVASPTVGRRTQLTAVAAASPTDVWAFGSYISDNPTGIHTRSGIVTEHWDGTRWRLAPQPVYHHTRHRFTIYAAVMRSSTQGWAVGGDRGTHTVALHRDGNKWHPTSTPGCCEFLAATATPEGGAWVAGYTDRPGHGFRSRAVRWTGNRFVPTPAPNVGVTTIGALSALPDGRVYLAGTGSNGDDTSYPILEISR